MCFGHGHDRLEREGGVSSLYFFKTWEGGKLLRSLNLKGWPCRTFCGGNVLFDSLIISICRSELAAEVEPRLSALRLEVTVYLPRNLG